MDFVRGSPAEAVRGLLTKGLEPVILSAAKNLLFASAHDRPKLHFAPQHVLFRPSIIRGVLLLLVPCLLSGCAAEAPPRPPRIQTPQAVKDLAVTQVGTSLRLRFTLPDRATDGRRLTKPIEVEVFRSIPPPAGPQPVSPSQPLRTIAPQDLSRFESGNEIEYADALAPDEFRQFLGSVFSYSVVTFTRGFRGHPHESGLSNRVEARLLNVSDPVVGFEARAAPRALELEWQAPRRGLISGAPLPAVSGYRLYRATGPTPSRFTLLAEVSASHYDDSKFQLGQTYAYKVRAVFNQGGHASMSADSLPVEITPRANFPPLPPTGLTAVYTGRAVELIWAAELDQKLAGYNVYRQEPDKPTERRNPQLLRTPAFTDSAITAGDRYTYWVTAVDAARNESKPSSRVSVNVR